jgi:hypothetical protein
MTNAGVVSIGSGVIVDADVNASAAIAQSKLATLAIDTAELADDAVTLDKLEDGTQGDILYYGASGAPTRLGFGTSGYFLKTQGTGANPVWAESGGGGLASVQTFTSSGTWTRPASITKVIMEVQGAGGGGSCVTSVVLSTSGGAGGCATKLLDVSGISSSTITIGSGGTGSATGDSNVNGGDGGASSWADGTNTVTGNGGEGGYYTSGSGPRDGGTATGGDFNVQGERGFARAGYLDHRGGNSKFGFGGSWAHPSAYSGQQLPTGYGGGGGTVTQNDAGTISFAGGDGIIIVWEYK